MKTSAKAISFLLTVVLCLNLLSICATATAFECEMVLAPYRSEGNVMVSVTTKEAAGAVSGTLTFDSELLSFDPEHTVCYEEGIEVADLCTVEGNTIAFVVATDDLTNGSTQWIDFAFTAKSEGTAAFSVSDARASNVEGNITQDITVAPVSIFVGDRIAKWNLTLGDSIGANFYAQLGDAANTEVKFTVAEKTAVVKASDVQTDGDGYYVFSVDVAAAQMTDPIMVELLVNGESVDSGSYTVRQYADTILSGDYTDAEKALVKAMLNYGGKAQTYFGYNTEAPANADITVSETDIPENVEAMSVSGKAEGINYYGATLVFAAKTAVRFYFTGNAAECTFTLGNDILTATQKGDMWYVEVAGINPQDLDKPITLTVNDTLTVAYSPLNYMARMYTKGSDNLQALLKAMYTYHLAAVEYTK